MLAADGTPLKASLRRALRAQKLRALMLVAPLLVFILVTFLFPIGDMLFRSVENQIVPNTLPKTVVALGDWDPASAGVAGRAGLRGAARRPPGRRRGQDPHPARHAAELRIFRHVVADAQAPVAMSGRWTRPCRFKDAVHRGGQEVGRSRTSGGRSSSSPARYTAGYLLNAVDLQLTPDGIAVKPSGERVYVKLFLRTVVHEPHDHRLLPAPRLPDRLPARQPAAAHLEPADDPGAAAVLDLAAGANRRLEGAAAAAGRHQRHSGLDSASSPTPTVW